MLTRLVTVLTVLCVFLQIRIPAAEENTEVLELWPSTPPDESGSIGPERIRPSPQLDKTKVEVTDSTMLITAVTNPTLTIVRPKQVNPANSALIVCPGGGYWDLYWQLEGEEVATWLNSLGLTAGILKYRVPRRPGEFEREPAHRPLQDAQRAVSLLRSKAGQFALNPEHIGIIGFSAGGHLAISTATEFERRSYPSTDEIDQVSCRPNFAVLVYPGYLKAKDKDATSPDLHIPKGTPPVFLVHGGEDIISSPEQSVFMYLALKRASIPAELHIYSGTAHDFGVRPTERPYSNWTNSCANWMKDLGFLKL